MHAPARSAFSYAVLRLVPCIQRGERINVAVVLFSRQHRFLAAQTRLDSLLLRALAPEIDTAPLLDHLSTVERIAAGDPGAGPIAAQPASDRFGWLTAPASTIFQPSPIHTGLTEDPARTLDHLFRELVA